MTLNSFLSIDCRIDAYNSGNTILWDLETAMVTLGFLMGDSYQSISTPGYATDVITVAACGKEMYDGGDIAYYSSMGPSRLDTAQQVSKPDITAPGGDYTNTPNDNNDLIQSASETNPNLFENRMQGTSMAAPHVTGAIALLLQNFPYLPSKNSFFSIFCKFIFFICWAFM